VFLRLLVRLARFAVDEQPPQLRAPAPNLYREEIVAAAVRTIDVDFSKPLRVEQLAAAAYLSRDRFTQVFALVMGRTPQDYIRHVRLERAKSLLAASAVDRRRRASDRFGTNAYLARVFRASVGQSPREFRRAAYVDEFRQEDYLASRS
jgi:transcriptional regulator GlxA family with amidase domain